MASLEWQLSAAVEQSEAQLAALQRSAAELEEERATLEGRVEKRHVELDRLERRLESLAVSQFKGVGGWFRGEGVGCGRGSAF